MAKQEKDNFQDRSEEREYKKGFRAGKQSSKRRRRGGSRRDSGDAGTGGNKYAINAGEINDPDWNAPTQQMLKDAFSIPFAEVVGQKHQFGTCLASYWFKSDKNRMWYSGSESNLNVPSICAYTFMPTYGENSASNDAINVGANSFYSFTVHMNSRRASYDASDLQMYGLALDSAYMFYDCLVRMYGFINYYQWYNRAVPRALVLAMGFDYDELVTQLADLRLFINSLAYKLQQLYFPRGFDYMNRHHWIVRDVYVDSQDQKAQLFFFKPCGYYKWTEGTTSDANNSLVLTDMVQLADNIGWRKQGNFIILGFEAIKRIANNLINPLIGSQDFNLMSGDLLKAFGASKAITIAPIAETYSLKPVYSEEILMETENMDLVLSAPLGQVPQAMIKQHAGINEGYLTTRAGLQYLMFNSGVSTFQPGWYGVITDSNSLTFPKTPTDMDAVWSTSEFIDWGMFASKEKLINMHKPVPEPKDVTVAINWKVSDGRREKNPENMPAGKPFEYMFRGYGTEIMLYAQLISDVNYLDSYWLSSTMINMIDSSSGISSAGAYNSWYNLRSVQKLSAFDWAPFITSIQLETSKQTGGVLALFAGMTNPIGDYDNFTTIGYDTLANMHRVANLRKFTNREMSPNFTPR